MPLDDKSKTAREGRAGSADTRCWTPESPIKIQETRSPVKYRASKDFVKVYAQLDMLICILLITAPKTLQTVENF